MLYGGETFVDLENMIEAASDLGAFSVDVEGGFAKVPPLEIVRCLEKGIGQDLDSMERVARYCLLGRKVTVYYGGEVIGSPFQMNGLNDDWGAFDVFEESPLALQYIFSLCMAHIIKKSVPRRKSTLGAAGQAL